MSLYFDLTPSIVSDDRVHGVTVLPVSVLRQI